MMVQSRSKRQIVRLDLKLRKPRIRVRGLPHVDLSFNIGERAIFLETPMRSIFASTLLVGCTAAPATLPDTTPGQTSDTTQIVRPHAQLEALIPRALLLRAPAELFDLREIREPENVGACELEPIAGPAQTNTPVNYNHSLVETYDQRNCPVYQSTARFNETEQLTLTVDGLYGEWRRSMWKTKLVNGMNAGTESGEWIDTPDNQLEHEQQAQQEYDAQGRLIKETSSYDNIRNTTSYDYDNQGRILAIWRDQGSGLRRSEAYGYGDYGTELIQYFDTSGQISRETRYQYDDRGMLRVIITRSLAAMTGYPASSREEYDENGNPVSSTTDQDGDGKADSEWRQEFGPNGMTYRRDRYMQDARESLTEWSATYDPEGRLIRSQSTSSIGGRTERLELTVNQTDAEGHWRTIRLTKDSSGIYGDLDVSNDQQFMYTCQLKLDGQNLSCSTITAHVYGANNQMTQYCTVTDNVTACQRYLHDPNGYMVTELFDDNDDGIAERRSEYRYGSEYTEKLIGYLTAARWEQIKSTPPPAQPVHLPEYDD